MATKSFGGLFYVFFSVLAFTFALVFLVPSITGNVIGNFILSDNRWMGVCFFLCGLVFTFFHFRKGK